MNRKIVLPSAKWGRIKTHENYLEVFIGLSQHGTQLPNEVKEA